MHGEISCQWVPVDGPGGRWDAAVAAAGGGNFHRTGLLKLEAGGDELRGIRLEADGTAALLGGWIAARGGQQWFHCAGLPSMAEPRLLQVLARWLSDEGITALDAGSFEGGAEHYDLTGLNAKTQQRYEFPWSLTDDETCWRAALHSNHRRKLNKLEKRGLRLSEIGGRHALVMSRLQHHWRTRRGIAGGIPAWWRNLRYYRRVCRHLVDTGAARLYGLYDEQGVLMTFALMLESPSQAFYMMGASSPAGYQAGASVALFWLLARRYREQGVGILNLGGVPRAAEVDEHPEHGVYRFKRGFGIEPTPRLSVRLELT